MAAVLAIALKDLKLLFRVKAAFFFTLVWPLHRRGHLRLAVRRRQPRPVADVHRHHRRGSDAGVEGVRRRRWRRAKASTCCGRRAAEARDLVRRGRRVGAVRVPKGFGEASQPHVLRRRRRRWSCGIDPARQAETAMLQGFLLEQAARRMQTLFGATPASRGDGRRHARRREEAAGGRIAGQAACSRCSARSTPFSASRPRPRHRRPAPRRRPAAAGSRSIIDVTSVAAAARGAGQRLPDHVSAGHAVGHPRLHDVVRDQPRRRALARHADAAADVAGAVVGAARRQGPGLLHGDPDRRGRARVIGAAFFGVRPSSLGAARPGAARRADRRSSA